MRVCLVSERLRRPYDEGIKNLATRLALELGSAHEVLTLTMGGMPDPEYSIRNIEVNRLFLGRGLASEIRHFKPDAIVYVPTACATLFSVVRARVLGQYYPSAHTAMITLQPRPYSSLTRRMMRCMGSPRGGRFVPDWVLAQSERTCRSLSGLGFRTALLPPAVDTERFRPPSPLERATLRQRYGLTDSARVVTHVGHLKTKRSLDAFLTLQELPDVHGIVVASTSTRPDEQVRASLHAAGVTVIDTYVPAIEDVYRLSDLYLFLAESETAAIELPLSVLEAMACNLPIVTTPFGGLADVFPAGNGLIYWDGSTDLRALIDAALSSPSSTRSLVAARTWAAAAGTLEGLLFDNANPSRAAQPEATR